MKYKLFAIIIILCITAFILTMYLWDNLVTNALTSTNYVVFLVAIGLIFSFVSFIFSKQAIKVDNDPNLIHSEQDRASFKKFSEMNIALIIAFYFALGSLLLVSLNDAPIWLGILSVIVLAIAIFMRYYGYGMINKLYPEKDLPNTFESDFDDKLIDALTKDEMITIFTGLYNAYKITNLLLPASLLLITLYGFHTGTSQQFALSVIALVAIVINTVYQVTVRKLI